MNNYECFKTMSLEKVAMILTQKELINIYAVLFKFGVPPEKLKELKYDEFLEDNIKWLKQ